MRERSRKLENRAAQSQLDRNAGLILITFFFFFYTIFMSTERGDSGMENFGLTRQAVKSKFGQHSRSRILANKKVKFFMSIPNHLQTLMNVWTVNMENIIVMMMHTVPTLREHSTVLVIMISKTFIMEMEHIVMVPFFQRIILCEQDFFVFLFYHWENKTISQKGSSQKTSNPGRPVCSNLAVKPTWNT